MPLPLLTSGWRAITRLVRGRAVAAPRVLANSSPAEIHVRVDQREQGGDQKQLGSPPKAYALPTIELLTEPPDNRGSGINEDALAQNARLLESVLEDFGVYGKILKVQPGPVVTLYEFEPSPGTKASLVTDLAGDIARTMYALSVRIAILPGRSVIGIEMSNSRPETVFLYELLASETFERTPARLPLALGKDIGGRPFMIDLAHMPHLLIAGTTGSGKSEAPDVINTVISLDTMVLSLLYRLKPEECRLIMIDSDTLELSAYEGVPHLLAPVVTEPDKAMIALKWAVREMEDRYRLMQQQGVRNITGYNQRLVEAQQKGEILPLTVQTGFDPDTGKPVYEDRPLDMQPLPFLVIVINEIADLFGSMLVDKMGDLKIASEAFEELFRRFAQMSCATGIHLIAATTRPWVLPLINRHFPSRISLRTALHIESGLILGEQGANQLLPYNDMLYMAKDGHITRVHGPFVSHHEVKMVAEYLKKQRRPYYVEGITEDDNSGYLSEAEDDLSDNAELYGQAVALIAREGKASTSFIQRHLQIGYNRAARIIEKMEIEGVVSRADREGKRKILFRNYGD